MKCSRKKPEYDETMIPIVICILMLSGVLVGILTVGFLYQIGVLPF